MKESLRECISKIKSGDSRTCEEFLKGYQSFALKIFEEDPFFDKIEYPDTLAKDALLLYIEEIKKDEISESSIKQDALQNFIKRSVKRVIHAQLKKLCDEVYRGERGAEERLRSYEINILNAIQKDRLSDILHDHSGIAQKVIAELISRIKIDGADGIDNFYTFITVVLKRDMIDQYRRERRIVLTPNGNPPNTSLKGKGDGILNRISLQKLCRILKHLFKFLDKQDQIILVRTYYNKMTCQQIADELFELTGRKYNKSTITRKRQKALQKLSMGFRKRGIHGIGDLGG